ncbi:MAG: hypothetical protein EXR31_11240, partial [Betaproteobacteria bacterium]|nr:hypothetical protein [Betaproteobacteria bacterium]
RMLRKLLADIFRRLAGPESGEAARLEALGKERFRNRWFAESADAFRRAVALAPRNAGLWNKMGFAQFECGQAEQAMEAYRKSLALEPDNPLAIQNFLFATAFTRETQAQSLSLHREWAPRLAAHASAPAAPHANTREPGRRLRIGYLSADLRGHTVAYYLAPILAHHDRERHSIHCYSNSRATDGVTTRLRGHADGWRDVAGLTDGELAAAIRADGIDILIDLSGHTAGNRLGAVALRPAPLQVTYLGYPSTLGLPAVGYRITDRFADPPGESASRYLEQLLYLPDCAWCFDPLRDAPDPVADPRRGAQTLFGSLNSVTKLSPETLALWAEVLRAVPASRLHLSRVPEGRLRDDMASAFLQRGIAADRVEFSGIVAVEQFSALTRRIDVALDPVPCNGGATTCETLWNGTPVVAMVGKTFPSRASYSILANCGLADLAAASQADYVRLAARLAGDASLRGGVRARVAASFRDSCIMRAPRFTRNYEAMLREAWREWCAQAR